MRYTPSPLRQSAARAWRAAGEVLWEPCWGAVTLSALKVGLVVLGVDTFWQYIAMGAIIIVAAYFEVIQTTLERRMSQLHVKA